MGAGPLGPRARMAKPGAPASAGKGPARFLRLLLPAPPGVSPDTELPGRALISRRGTAPSRSRPSPATRPAEPGDASPTPRPHGHGAATRGGERREGPSAPDVEDVPRDARPGGTSRRRPPPFRRRREWPPSPRPRPRPGPDAAARRCRGARQPMGSEEVGLRAAVTRPGTGARRLGAREPRPRPGRGGGAGEWEEEPPSSSPRTTAPQAAEDRPGRTPDAPRPRPPA